MLHKRKALRLTGFNYASPGAYYITICTHGQKSIFGTIEDNAMKLNDFGRIVEQCWFDLNNHYASIQLYEFVIMPNHIHGIIMIGDAWAGLKPAPTYAHHGIPEIVRAFKTFSSRRINKMRNTPGTPVWQRNYYEHIIRNDESMQRISNYIKNNPSHWTVGDQSDPNTYVNRHIPTL